MKTLLCCFILLSGFFSQAAEPALPQNHQRLPLVRQQTNYSCGPAAFLAILKYWDVFNGTEQDLYGLLKTTEADGTNPRNIVAAANQMKLTAHFEENVTIEKLKESWLRGESVILDLQAWRDDTSKPWKDQWSEGHYISLVGLDAEYLYAMDPSVSEKFGYIPLNELYERWHDFEVENGKEWKNQQLAIFIKGTTTVKPFPPPEKLVQID